MKPIYETPTADVCILSRDDVIRTSGERRDYDGEWDREM